MLAQSCIAGNTVVKLAESIETGIRTGALAAGERLPPIRTVAEHLGVSPATVSSAFRRLQQRGLLTAQGRSGTIVSRRLPLPAHAAPSPRENVFDCATGNPDPKLLPKLGPALAAVRRTQTLYDAPPCHPDLVRLGGEQYRRDGLDVARICVVNGSLDGIERALAESLFAGDRVVVEDPCFNGVLDLLRARGLVPVPVRLDESGMIPEALESAIKQRPKALIVTPRAQNPTGAALTSERAAALREVLAKAPELIVVEDDYEADLSGVPYAGLCQDWPGRWVVVRSLCKGLGPDLRIALVGGDEQTISMIEGRQILGIRWVSHLLQDMAVHYLGDPDTQKRVKHARATYEKRRVALRETLDARGVESMGRSGFNVWVPVLDEASVTQELLQAGWLVTPGQRYRVQSAPGIRVSAATLDVKLAPRLAQSIASAVHGAGASRTAV